MADGDTDIAYQNKDIFSKWMGETLKGKSFEAYGLDLPKIVRVEPTNLPTVEAYELRIDNLFMLEDGSWAIVDYESCYTKEDKVKYANYLVGVMKRCLIENGEFPRLRMIVIYTADIERGMTDDDVNMDSLGLHIYTSFLSELSGDEIYNTIDYKLKTGEPLSDKDCMQLMIFPLTYKARKMKQEAITKAIDLADRLQDDKMLTMILSGLLVFCDKVIDDESSMKIKERIRMTKVGRLFEEEKREAVEAERVEFDKERVSYIRRVMKKLNYTAEQAMEFLNINRDDFPKYAAML
ncbi:MAG: hypothetical protein ACI4OA_05395 [Selenomonadaceae bacterium]